MGRFKLIESPEVLWKLFQDYKEFIKAKPIEVGDWVGGMAIPVDRKKERPLTMEGFENYVADLDGYPMDLGDYFENRNDAYTNFSAICQRVKRAIRQDQIEGGMAGIYNPSITQRLNGLVDKTESKITQEMPLFGDE